jgi:serine O-acetyltransferase
MPHAHGIVIGQHVRIGNNVTALQGTTVGTDLIREEYAPSTMPQIGNRVFLGAGSKVLGAVRIGDDAVIGANAVVISDVPAGALAVGVPAVIKFNRNQKGKERA